MEEPAAPMFKHRKKSRKLLKECTSSIHVKVKDNQELLKRSHDILAQLKLLVPSDRHQELRNRSEIYILLMTYAKGECDM